MFRRFKDIGYKAKAVGQVKHWLQHFKDDTFWADDLPINPASDASMMVYAAHEHMPNVFSKKRGQMPHCSCLAAAAFSFGIWEACEERNFEKMTMYNIALTNHLNDAQHFQVKYGLSQMDLVLFDSILETAAKRMLSAFPENEELCEAMEGVLSALSLEEGES